MNRARGASALPGVLLLLALPQDALAYIDPGTGSLVVQGLIAGAAAAAALVRHYWYSIKGFFRRGGAASAADDKAAEPSAEKPAPK